MIRHAPADKFPVSRCLCWSTAFAAGHNWLFTHNRSGDDRSPHPVAVIEVDRTCRADLCTGAATNAQLSGQLEIQMGKPAGICVGHPKRLDSHFAAGSHAKAAANADVATQTSPGFIFCH